MASSKEVNAMNEWSVEIVASRPDDISETPQNLDEALLDALPEIADDRGAVGSVGDGEYSVRMVVEAAEILPALQESLVIFQKVTEYGGLPSWPIIDASVTEWTVFESSLEEPDYPTLLGVTELSEILQVSKQRASELARLPHFPRPVAQLASGPVWDYSMIQTFVAEWDRKPGRPKRVLSEEDVKALEGVGAEARHWDKETMDPNHPGFPS